MPKIDVQGVPIHYEESGAGPVILFVHGWGASWKFWRSAMARLSARFRCIALDLAGFGDSGKPAGWSSYTMEAQAVSLRRFLDALEIPKVTLVGHSMGGMISALFALLFGHRAAGLATVNAPIEGPTSLFLRSKLLILPVIRWLMHWLAFIPWVRRWVAKDFTYACPLPDELVDDIIHATFDAQMGSLYHMTRTDLAPRVAEISCPALVYATDHDYVVQSNQFALVRDRIPGARTALITDTGHCPMIERPEVFEQHLESFLAATATAAPAPAPGGAAAPATPLPATGPR